MPVSLEDNFLILEHKASFGFVLYPSRLLIYKNHSLVNQPLTPWLPCQWSITQQRDSPPRLSSAELLDIDSACLILFMDKKELSLVLLDFLSCFHFGSSCAPTRHSINSTHGQGVHSTSHIITHCEEVSEFLTLIHKFTLQSSILESILSSTWCKFDPDTAYVVCISVWLGFPYRFSFRFIWYSYHFFLMWYPYHLVFLIWNPYHSVSLMW